MLLYLIFSILQCSSGFQPIIEKLNYSQEYTFTINSSVEYILEFEDQDLTVPQDVPPRIWVESDAETSAPLMIVARQPQEMLSWQLPLVLESESGEKQFNDTSRTLCHDIIQHNRQMGLTKLKHDNPIISVSTSSAVNRKFMISLRFEKHFYIQHSQEYNFTISPSQPRYFYYNFSQNVNKKSVDSNYETVILEVGSDDDICMTVSIQNVSCPVFDTNQDVTFRGFYETVNKRGGITIPKYKFPLGFYVVFVAKADDYQCTKYMGYMNQYQDRIKTLTLVVKPSITYSDYVMAVMLTLAAIGGFYVVFGISYFLCTVRGTIPRQMAYAQRDISAATSPRAVTTTDNAGNIGSSPLSDSISVDETEYDFTNEVETNADLRLGRGNPCLSDLATKHPKVLKKKSYLYLYNVLTVAVFYGLPVVQLVIAYQRMLNETGQQDLCYYNFLCAHPMGLISDFNHLFSNIGYVLLGVLFLIIVYIREHSHKDIDFDKNYGIPQHYGLYYAMGVALMMEGILSGSYHVCPNQMNFQFDSSFMYVMSVLCMVKLYQNRHPDINASAYTTFGVLAIAVLLGMIGLFEGTTVFWAMFIVVYLITCIYISIKIYYMGCWKLSKLSPRGMYQQFVNDFHAGPLNVLKPCHKARFSILFMANICNWALAFFALYKQPKNFAVFLLAIFMANTLIYFFFYIIMKYLNKERVKIATWIYLACSTLCAISALYFFVHKAISWTSTPAQSRQFNMECKLLRFYDNHDIWHFLSAIGMFFTFMVLLTLDDDISHEHHTMIKVF